MQINAVFHAKLSLFPPPLWCTFASRNLKTDLPNAIRLFTTESEKWSMPAICRMGHDEDDWLEPGQPVAGFRIPVVRSTWKLEHDLQRRNFLTIPCPTYFIWLKKYSGKEIISKSNLIFSIYKLYQIIINYVVIIETKNNTSAMLRKISKQFLSYFQR